MAVWILVMILLSGLAHSVRLRMRRYRQSVTAEPKVSLISLAIQELVAIAGGVYVSLIMFVSFLKITVPEKVWIGAVEVDPLALLAICLGIVQPIITNIMKKVR